MSVAATARVLVISYGAMLCVVGAAGILFARWELGRVFSLDVTMWSHDVNATFLNQYRFLKAVEFSSGLFCLAYLKSILTGEKSARIFLALVAAGVAARIIAWIADGQPSALFLIFLALEILVFCVVVIHLRQSND